MSSSRLRWTWKSSNNSNNGHMHWVHTKQALSTVSHGSKRSPWDPALYYWLMIGNGKWGILVLGCGPTAEPNTQQRAPNLWSYQWPWLNLVGHKTNQIDMDMREIFVERVEWAEVLQRWKELGERVGRENGQYALCTYVKLSKNKSE